VAYARDLDHGGLRLVGSKELSRTAAPGQRCCVVTAGAGRAAAMLSSPTSTFELGGTMRQFLAAIAFAALCGSTQAQPAYPARPVTLVVPFPAGGTADLLCRFAADRAGSLLGQQVVVENRPGGAGGRVGMEQVLRAPPDGYTLLCSTQLSYSITHLIFTKSAFDPRALEPISVLATYPLILITRAALAANTLPEFIALARKEAGKLTYGHQGKGNTGHLLGELLMLKGQFKMTEVPYRGSAPAINDLLAGNIDLVPDYLLANKQNIDTGKLKLIATGSRERLKDYPNVATIAETLSGVFADTWMAVSAPPGTPKDITKKVSDAIGQGFRQPEMRARILALEADPLASTPQQMRDLIQQSLATWGPVVEAAKITVE
jgi:tripartite-type tricarboxylate transporter receptor subunit TctC